MEAATPTGADDPVIEQIAEMLGAEEMPPHERDRKEKAEPEPVQETEQEPVQEAEAEETAVEEPQEEDVEEYELDPSDLARLIGVDENALINTEEGVRFRTKIDGSEGEASLADLLKSYQLEGHLNKRNMEFVEQRKAFEQQASQQQAMYEQRLNESASMLNIAEQQVLGEFNNIDWESLRHLDAAEYVAKRQEFQDRMNNIQNSKAQLNNQATQIQQERQMKQQQWINQVVNQEKTALMDSNPEWREPGYAKQRAGEIKDYLKGLNFSDNDVSNLIDHRQILVLEKAMAYDNLQKSKPDVKKKVKSVPKLSKPGTSKSKKQLEAASRKSKIESFKRTGSEDALMDILLDQL